MGKTPALSPRSRFLRRAEETNRPSSVDKIPLAMLCRGCSGPPKTPPWGPMRNHCVNGFAGGSTVAGCSGSAVIVTGATNTERCCMDHPEGCLIIVFFNTGDNLDAT